MPLSVVWLRQTQRGAMLLTLAHPAPRFREETTRSHSIKVYARVPACGHAVALESLASVSWGGDTRTAAARLLSAGRHRHCADTTCVCFEQPHGDFLTSVWLM